MRILKHHLFWPCFWLFCASAIFTFLWWFVPNDRLSGIFGNLAAGFFGTVVTVLFVDRVVEAHQERQRKRYSDIALRSLGVPLRRHFGFLCEMLKVSVTQEPGSKAGTLAELFGPDYVKALGCLDFSRTCRVGVIWADEAHNEFRFFLTELTRCLDKYAAYLDSELVAVVEGILTSEMVGLAGHIQNLIRQRTVAPTLFADPTMTPLIERYTHHFVALAEAYNKTATEERFKILVSDEIWRKDVMPAIGSAVSTSGGIGNRGNRDRRDFVALTRGNLSA